MAAFALFVVGVLLYPSNSGSQSGWQPLAGNVWSGVKAYVGNGPQKNYVGEVLGGNDSHVDPLTGDRFRGIKIRYPSGSEEWKDRTALINTGYWYVRADDPALAEQRWYVLRD